MAQENVLDLGRDHHPLVAPLSPFLRDAQRINSALGEGFDLLQGVLGPQQLLDNIISILKSGIEVADNIEEQLLGLAENVIETTEAAGREVLEIPPRLPYQLRQRPITDKFYK